MPYMPIQNVKSLLHSQMVVIKDNLPWETDVEEILKFHVEKLQEYLKKRTGD